MRRQPCDHASASGPRGVIAPAIAETAADVRRLAVETHLAGGSTHSARPYRVLRVIAKPQAERLRNALQLLTPVSSDLA